MNDTQVNLKLKEILREEAWHSPEKVRGNFSALYAIALYDRKLLEGGPLGKISSLLIALESKPGGPYYSSLKDKNIIRTIDRSTNEHIYRFLSVYDIRLPGLSRFLKKEKVKDNKKEKKHKRILKSYERSMIKKIENELRSRLLDFPPEFKKLALSVVQKTIAGNPDAQMSLMPYYMKKALGKKARGISEKVIVSMGLVNVFFWASFIIYDDFWDEDEAAEPRLLPVANLFARSYTDFFSTLFLSGKDFRTFFHRTMDKLDAANSWETLACRAKIEGNIFQIPKHLPKYGNYAKKYYPASGHVFGPLALLVLSGYKINSKEAEYLVEYFRNYLIAMQMNDDMHDWEEDLKRGHISTAVDLLLRDVGAGKKNIDLEKDMSRLRQIFWFTTLPKIAKKALHFTKKSHAALLSMTGLTDISYLEYFVNLNQKIAEKALSEHSQSVKFLSVYQKSYKNKV